jgi:hypothetical protein
MGQTKTGDVYDIVRRADGAVVDSLILSIGCRILLNRSQVALTHRNIHAQERFVNPLTLREMVREMTAKN